MGVMNFDHYYRGGRFTQTAEFVEFCKPLLPKYIDTILEFGCANGRNLIPFNGKYNLQGYDLPTEDGIEFRQNFDNFVYEKKYVEEWVKEYDKDLSTTFVMCSGVLMYVTTKVQNALMKKLFDLGCKNMAFQEYYPTMHSGGYHTAGVGGIGFDKKYIDLFEIHHGWENNALRDEALAVLIGIDGYNWNTGTFNKEIRI